MSADRDVTRIVESWLEEGVTSLPYRVLDAVLDQVPATRQRRSWWPARRLREMNRPIRVALVAAAVVVVAVVGINLLPGFGGSGGPGPTPTSAPTPTPTSTPTSAASPAALHIGALAAGVYEVTPFAGGPLGACLGQAGCTESLADDTIRFTFTVPDGWSGTSLKGVWLTAGHDLPPGGALVIFERGGWLYSTPCGGNPPPDIPVGPSVDDFANALAAHPLLDTTTPTGVVLGGYAGKYLDLYVPADISACSTTYFAWEPGLYAQGPSQRWHIWILDVDGTRVVVVSTDYVGTSAQDGAALQAIVDSIKITP